MSNKKVAVLSLEDGTKFTGFSFGAETSAQGEVVFNTSMTGYPELLSDPASRRQILVLTYPLIGNYGVPPMEEEDGLLLNFESDGVQVSGLVVTDYSEEYSHWNAAKSLGKWLKKSGVPAIYGVDTREVAKHLREHGEMRGKIVVEGAGEPKPLPTHNLMEEVSTREIKTYGEGGDVTIALIDTGVKNNVIRSLVRRGAKVVRLPWNVDPATVPHDGLMLAGSPDDPAPIVEHVRRALAEGKPVFGVCGGDLPLALAAGGRIKRLSHGHHGTNQPVLEVGTPHAQITTQKHSWVVDEASLPADWEVWYTNLNDGSVEGIRHKTKPFGAVQFHPEATARPVGSDALYDEFVAEIRKTARTDSTEK